jgi:hypothetical protein
MKSSRLFGVVLAVLVGGCASLPDATVSYYLAQSTVSFKVTRTFACDSGKNLIVANSVTPLVTHFADPTQRKSISFERLKGWFSDSDVKFEFSDDGRLKSINAATEGKGEEILKAGIQLAKTAATALILAINGSDVCGYIAAHGGDSKVLTLTYEDDVVITAKPEDQVERTPIKPTSASEDYAKDLYAAIGGVCAVVASTGVAAKPLVHTGKDPAFLLSSRQPALVGMKVLAGPAGQCSREIWNGKLAVAQRGTDYVLPVPRPPLFGKQVFAAVFADSGALSSVQYASTTGAAQALNVGNSLLTALQGRTAAQKAADIQAEADLIVQQQRLVLCHADPTSCK